MMLQVVHYASFFKGVLATPRIFNRITCGRLEPLYDINSFLRPAVGREQISFPHCVTLRVMTTIWAGVNMMIVVPRKRFVVPLHDVHTVGWVAFRINVQSVAFPPELSERF